jgi:hypothetical protein
MKRLLCRIGLVAALIASLAMVGAAEDPPSGHDAATKPRAVHADPQAVINSVVAATRAFLREDSVAARQALDGLKQQSPPLERERDEAYGHEILSFDQAFHITIDRSREYALAGYMEDSFNQFVWVQRACITCHGMARDKGFLPPLAESTKDSDQHAGSAN